MPSTPADVFNIFTPTATADPWRSMQDHWTSVSAKCKDVIVLAMPIKELPVTREAYQASGATDFMRAQFYVVRVGSVDGQDWGWSNAPYDCAKKTSRSDIKPLYTIDDQGETKGETRFWSFKKVSNNKNKGARVEEPIDGMDTSFNLPTGSVLTFFMREEAYEPGKNVFVGAGDVASITAFSPVLLQLSGSNSEQALKGNGLKLRRVMPLRQEAMTPFLDDLCSSKRDALERQDAARRYPAISNVAGRTQTCPLKCELLSNAFVYQDEELREREMVEIAESGLEPDSGSVLHLPVGLMLSSLHTEDFERAQRFLSVALGHGAVKCMVVPSETPGVAVVQHLHIDMHKMLWLPTLQKLRTSDRPAELPTNDNLFMCFGRRIGLENDGTGFGSENVFDVLQWYNPSKSVPLATPDGREVMSHFVFEMDLEMKRSPGVQEVYNKYFLMDEADGLHHGLRVFTVERPVHSPETGLGSSENARIFITWQLRPAHKSCNTGTASGRTTRKRPFFASDEIDRINTNN